MFLLASFPVIAISEAMPVHNIYSKIIISNPIHKTQENGCTI